MMAVVSRSIYLPNDLWHAVQSLAYQEGDTNTVIIRALEEYITTQQCRGRQRSGKYAKLVKALSTPTTALHLSTRPASALKLLNVCYAYKLVQQSPLDLFRLPNFGEKSFQEVKDKLAALGSTLGMTVDDDSYRAAVVAAVAANVQAARRGGMEWRRNPNGGV